MICHDQARDRIISPDATTEISGVWRRWIAVIIVQLDKKSLDGSKC
jgi:hypothetical protein